MTIEIKLDKEQYREIINYLSRILITLEQIDRTMN